MATKSKKAGRTHKKVAGSRGRAKRPAARVARARVVKKARVKGRVAARPPVKAASRVAPAEKKAPKEKVNAAVPPAEDAKKAIDQLLGDDASLSYLKKNVSKRAIDVITMLSSPKTDEYIAEQLGTKINAVRRMLNLMQNYGITNYYVSKNVDGWLSFAWYINTGKIGQFFDYIKQINTAEPVVKEDCDDYFICNACYSDNKLIFPFDAAFEEQFKCNMCGSNLKRVDKDGVKDLVAQTRGETETSPLSEGLNKETV
ncbi:MAG: hypothetical protein KGH98_03385 [Candidatus Micrarchaeota archaeon]|nr:hypothetical protein [Candidatus Micrarchaeota archaeon]